jgi:hypothetical protein
MEWRRRQAGGGGGRPVSVHNKNRSIRFTDLSDNQKEAHLFYTTRIINLETAPTTTFDN